MITGISRSSMTIVSLRFSSFLVLPSRVPKGMLSSAAGCHRSATSETYAKKEKVEEDRFIRERERAILEKKYLDELAELEKQHTAAGIKGNINKEAQLDAKLTLYVKELETLLVESGDKISAQGLYNVAKWKLDAVSHEPDQAKA